MRKALLVAAAVIGLSGPVEAESSNFGYNLSTYDTCAGLLLSVSWRLEAVGENELSKHYKNGADTHGITAVAERHTMNDPTDTYEHMLITAHAFANVLNTEGTNDVVRKCDAMVPRGPARGRAAGDPAGHRSRPATAGSPRRPAARPSPPRRGRLSSWEGGRGV